MHSAAIHEQVRSLVAAGVNDCEISRRLGIARTTVRDIRAPRYMARDPDMAGPPCPRCGRAARRLKWATGDYAELLGFYLGDGCISRAGRTYRLRISMDAKYPDLVQHLRDLIERCFPKNRSGVTDQHDGTCKVVWVYSSHLPCLFPQHGAGKKHDRPIVLERWQRALVNETPERLVRGLLWSDGCRYINRTGPYEYVSYCFDNVSADILDLFVKTAGSIGVVARASGTSARVYRRESVAILEQHVGPKR